MLSFEIDFLLFLEGMRNNFLNAFFEGITMLGEETLLLIFLSVIYFMFNKELARRIFFVTAFSLSVNCIIKNFVKMPRPFALGHVSCVRPDTATGYSFPSGHTQNIATWSTAFAIVIKKKWMTAAAIIGTILLGFSRMYLGAHYPSDVVVGAYDGVALAFLCSAVYDRVENKNLLYACTFLLFTPFAILFMFTAEPLYEDFYKVYGMLAGLLAATAFEEKYVSFDYSTSLAKRIMRVVISVILAFAVKEGVKKLFALTFTTLRLSLAADAVRYFVLVFIMLGVCPLIFKKIKI